jgi:prepilin-type N-terminal cleavage/methylation domain-containing protein/prepilin-type processing-associated H-X9-DG protein
MNASVKRPSRAFTLVEVLVVITIVAILVAMLLPALAKSRANALKLACLANARSNLQGVFMYSDSYNRNLPDDGGTTEYYSLHLMSPGGLGHRKPSGLGSLFYDGIFSNMASMYCPAEAPDTFWFLTKKRAIQMGYYADREKFKVAIDTGTIDSFFSYAVRFKRWGNNNGIAALAPGQLNYYSTYLYNFDKGPLAVYPRVSLISDTFMQRNSWVTRTNFSTFYHGDGLNTAFSDGSATFINDRGGQLKKLPVTLPSEISVLNPESEDIWDALDGDIGYDPYAFIDKI